MRVQIILIISLIIILSSCEEQKGVRKDLKSIYKTQNDTIVGIEIFDRQGRNIFNRTTQIIGSWNNELMTWMTAKQFENNKQTFEYYAHSNTGLRITIFDYNQDGQLNEKYSKYYSSSNSQERNPFVEIYKIKSPDSLISYLRQTIPDSIPFTKHHSYQRESTKYYKAYLDSNNFKVKEHWTIQDSNLTYKAIEKYDYVGRLIYDFNVTPYNKGYDEYKYNSKGQIIEELEFWDIEKNRFQRKKHEYKNGRLDNTMFYHDTSLAFTYEYFYNDTLLIRELKTRITDTEHFKNRKKTEEIEYKYQYY